MEYNDNGKWVTFIPIESICPYTDRETYGSMKLADYSRNEIYGKYAMGMAWCYAYVPIVNIREVSH